MRSCKLLSVLALFLTLLTGSFVRADGPPGASPGAPLAAAGFRVVRELSPCGTYDARTGVAIYPHHGGRHLITMAGAHVVELANGLWGITETEGWGAGDTNPDDGPYVLWYVMEGSGYCTAGPAPATCPFEPYVIPNPPPTGYPNPNRAAASYSNITRHWPSNPTYYVNVPAISGELQVDLQQDIYQATAITYTYQEFLWDVAFTMAKYSARALAATSASLPSSPIYLSHPCSPSMPLEIGNRHSWVTAVFGGHTGTAWIAPGNPQGGLLWSTYNGGPTGDSTNEIIFITPGSFPGITAGFASMIVVPATGRILECDVIFPELGGVGIPTTGPSPQPCAGLVGGPAATVLINHELGHFFGLDHSNLHTGVTGPGPSATTPLPVNGAPGSAAVFTALNQYPGMVSNAGAQMGFWVTDPNLPLHPDDAAAMATLYPVRAPDPPAAAAQKRPVINDFGRFQGLVTYMLVDNVKNTWGLNLFPLPAAPPGAPQPSPTPQVGTLVGLSRLQPGAGVVGRVDSSVAAMCSGGFRLNGVPPCELFPTYSLEIESIESLGFGIARGTVTYPPGLAPAWGEWFWDLTYNNIFNAIPGYGTDEWGGAGPVPLLTLMSRLAHPTSLGTLFVYPGTVISLNINLAVTTIGPEQVTRPAIQITPRTGLAIPFSGTITATVQHDYELDFGSARWQVVGGADFDAGTPTTMSQPPNPQGASGPWTSTWSVPAQSILGTSGPVTLQFTCVELGTTGNPQDPHRPPPGITPVWGVNEVGF